MPTEKWKKENVDKIRAYRRKWYILNKKHAISKVRKRQQELKEWYRELKSSLKCEECGATHIAVLTFHHLDPSEKELDVGQAAHNGWSKEKILNEIKKCKCLCRNCHAIIHWEELENRESVGAVLSLQNFIW